MQAPPKDGQANQAIVEFMASVLGLKKRDLSVVKGDKCSDKILLIDTPGSLTATMVISILREQL